MTGVVVQVGRRVVAWVVAAVVTVALVAGGLLVARGGLDRSPAVLPALDLGATGAVAADSTAAAGGAEPAPAGGGGVAPARPTDASSVPRLWPSVTYRLAGPLPALPDRARAWRVADDPGSGRVAALAAGLGLAGRPREEAGGWTVKDGNRVLSVNRQAGAPFGFTGGDVVAACAGGVAGRPYPEMGMQCLDPDSPVSNTPGTVTGGGGSTGGAPGGGGGSLGTGGSGRGGGGGSLGSAGSAGSSPGGVGGGAPVPPAPTPKAPARPAPPATTPKAPARPLPRPEVPSREEAERVARELAANAGLDLQGAAVHVSDGYAVRVVTIAPAVGGLPTSGFGWTVNVGAKGRVLFATGYLGTPEAGDTYPLIGVEAGFERLKRTPARPVPLMERPGIEPAIAPNPCPGTKVPCTAKPLPARVATVTGVRLGLQLAPVVADGSRPAGKAFLLPAYLFELKGGWTDLRAVIAVQDRYLTKP